MSYQITSSFKPSCQHHKVGCLPLVIVSILRHAEFGPNDHREDVPHFIYRIVYKCEFRLFIYFDNNSLILNIIFDETFFFVLCVFVLSVLVPEWVY